mgnify:CR=1 FL=1
MVLIRVHCAADSGATASFERPARFPDLCDTVAEGLGLQRSSLTLRSKHAASPQDTWVLLSNQEDLEACRAEAFENSMPSIAIEASGSTARRDLDAVAFALALAASVAQLAYLCLADTERPASFWPLAGAWVVAVVLPNPYLAGRAVG